MVRANVAAAAADTISQTAVLRTGYTETADTPPGAADQGRPLKVWKRCRCCCYHFSRLFGPLELMKSSHRGESTRTNRFTVLAGAPLGPPTRRPQ